MLKRGYVGVYHRFSQQHLDRYVKEYAKRRSMRELDTIDQMTELITQFWGRTFVLDEPRHAQRDDLVDDVSHSRHGITTTKMKARRVPYGFVDRVCAERSRRHSCQRNETSSS